MADPGAPQQYLDPTLMAHIQNGFPLPEQAAAPALAPVDQPPAGQLRPEVVAGVQSGFQPPPPAPDAPLPVQNTPDFYAPVPHATAKDVAVFKQQDANRAALEAKHQAELATPEGQQDQAVANEVKISEERANAAEDLGQVQKQNSDEAAVMMQKANEEKAVRLAMHAAEVEQQQQETKEHIDKYAQATDAEAKRQIDPNRSWHDKTTGGKIASIFAILMSGVGQGLSGGKGGNLAFEMLNEAKRDDIDAQKASIAQGQQYLSNLKDVNASYQHLTDDKNAQWALRDAEKDKLLANQLEAHAATIKGTQQAATMMDAAQAFRVQAQQTIGNLATQKVAQNAQKKQLAIAQQNANTASGQLSLAKSGQEFDQKLRTRQQDTAERQFDQTLAERYLTAKNAGDTAKATALAEQHKFGLYDPATGDPILDADGVKLNAQADDLEKKATYAATPEVAAAHRVQAAKLREEAQSHIATSENAKELKPKLAGAQDLVDGITGMINELDKDPSSFDRSKMAQLQTMFERAKMANINFLGAKVSSREMQAMEELYGSGSDSMSSRIAGRGKIKAHLETILNGIQSDTDSMLRSEGVVGPKGTYRLRPTNGDKVDTLTGKTSVEAASDATPGLMTKLGSSVRDVLHPIDTINGNGSSGNETIAAENTHASGPTGLAPDDTAKVVSLLGRYNHGTDAERAKILTTLTSFASSDRPSIANGVMGLVRSNPEVFKLVRSQLSPDMQETYADHPQFDPTPGKHQ